MNTVTKIRRADAAPVSANETALRDHAESVAALDREEQAVVEKLTAARALLAVAEQPVRELAALEALHVAVVEAELTGDKAPADKDDVLEQIAAKATEAASQATVVKGATQAIEKLHLARNDIITRRAALQAQRNALLFRQAVERQVALIPNGEQVTAALSDWWCELFAWSIVRDLLRPAGVPPCSIGLKFKFHSLAPFNMPEFAEFARERNLGDRIEARAGQILAELGVDRAKLGVA